MQLTEKYRPSKWSDVIGQEKAVGIISRLSARCFGGRAYWLTGASGTGKTTIAKILADKYCDPTDVTEIVARQLTVQKLQEIRNRWAFVPIKQGHALIVNEAHGLAKPLIEVFLDILESLPDKVVVIFTTTNEGNDLFEEKVDSSPFGSRCVSIQLARRNICEPFAERAKQIAQAENLDGRPLEDYVKLVRKHRNNLRAVLIEVEQGTMLA